MFTDIVGSTDRAAALGDRAWGEVLERHHELVRAMLARYRGQEVDTAGLPIRSPSGAPASHSTGPAVHDAPATGRSLGASKM